MLHIHRYISWDLPARAHIYVVIEISENRNHKLIVYNMSCLETGCDGEWQVYLGWEE